MLEKFLLCGLILATSIFSNVSDVSAEVRTIEADGEYSFGDGENTDVAKERAQVDAMRNASQQASLYVRSQSKMVDHVITEDIVNMISANVLKLQGEPIFRRGVSDDGKAYFVRCHVKVIVDDDNITEYLTRDQQELDRATRLNQYYEDENRRLKEELERLKKEQAKATTESERSKISAQIQQNDVEFLASHYFDLGNKEWLNADVAITYYNKAIELNPNFAEAYSARACTYLWIDKYDLALADFTKVIELNPNSVEAYLNRAVSYPLAGKYDLALADYAKVIEINPQCDQVYVDRGLLLYGLEMEEYDLAISDFTRAIEINPRNVFAYLCRGHDYQNLGENRKAIADYQKTLELEPDNQTARQKLNSLSN